MGDVTARRRFPIAGLLTLAALAGGCDLSGQGAGITVHVTPVVPRVATTTTAYVEVLDSYVSPGRAGSPVRLAATLSNQTLHTEVLVRIGAPTGGVAVHLTMTSGSPLVLPVGVALGHSHTALTRGELIPVTFTFTGAPAVTLRVPVGGTPALSFGS